MDASPGGRRRFPRSVAVAARVYRLLLVAYPASFRRAYGRHMAQVFRDACRDAFLESGSRGVLALWLRTLIDLASTAFQEHADRLARRIPALPSRVIPVAAPVALAESARVEEIVESSPMSSSMSRRYLMIRRMFFGSLPPRYIPMPLPDRFTERARRALRLADTEARALGHAYIGTEHVLLGLIAEHEGVAAEVLRELHVEHDTVRERVLFIIGHGDSPVRGDPATGDLTLTPRAARVVALSSAEAYALGHPFIGTEHVLLGLLREGEGIAAGVLDSLGVRLDEARACMLRVLRERQ
jgi:Clp amino terminal domain, pathogenicity island component